MRLPTSWTWCNVSSVITMHYLHCALCLWPYDLPSWAQSSQTGVLTSPPRRAVGASERLRYRNKSKYDCLHCDKWNQQFNSGTLIMGLWLRSVTTLNSTWKKHWLAGIKNTQIVSMFWKKGETIAEYIWMLGFVSIQGHITKNRFESRKLKIDRSFQWKQHSANI